MKQKRTENWYDTDLFWQTFEPELFSQERLETTPEEVERITKLLNIEPPARILDLCCGIGRDSLELARRGYTVTGVDRTQSYLAKARKQAVREGLRVDFVRADMRRFCQLEAYDAVMSIFTSFGYFKDPCDDRRVALNMYSSLKKGGMLLIDTVGKEIIARIFQRRDWSECNGRLWLQERQVSDDWSWMENRWILIENNQKREFKVDHRIYSAVELSSLLKQAGFARVDVYGDLSGTAYEQNAKRLVVVARK